MQVDTLSSDEALANLEANWNALYMKDPEALFFMSWTWISQVLRNYPDQCRVLAVRPCAGASQYVGFFPIRVETIWSETHRVFRNEVHLAGRAFWGQYNGFLCDPDWEEQVMACLADRIKAMRWSRISLRYLHASARRLGLLMDRFPDELFRKDSYEIRINKGMTDNLVCPYVDLPDDYDTYLQTCVSPNTRQKIRRFSRKLESSGDLRITTSGPDTLERDLDILIDLWTKRWAASTGEETAYRASKYRQILGEFGKIDALHVAILWENDVPLGALASFVDRQKPGLFFFISGRDEARAEPFIGWVLHAHSIKWAIESGLRTYDFCHGNEPYKYSYGAKERHLDYVVVRTRSGVNLNGLVDRSSIPDVLEGVVDLMDLGRLEDARRGCRQAIAASRARA